MRLSTLSVHLVCWLSQLILAEIGCSAAEIPKTQLSKLIKSAGLEAPWQIDQLSTGRNGTNWALSILGSPRSIDADYCLANLVNLGVELRNGKYTVIEKDGPRSVVAWKPCRRASFQENDFHDTFGITTDSEFVDVMHVVENFVVSGGMAKSQIVHFKSESLRRCLRRESLQYVQILERKKDGSVLISFLMPQLIPDEMDVWLTRRPDGIAEFFVSRGPGPDLVFENSDR